MWTAAQLDLAAMVAGSIMIASPVDSDGDERLKAASDDLHLKRLQQVVSSSPAVLFTVTLEDGQFRGIGWMSDNVERLLGYTVQDTLGADWWLSNIHPDDRDRVTVQFLSEIMGQGDSVSEYRFRHRDGTYRWIRGETRLVRDSAGDPVEAVGSFSDITERKLLEEQFRQAQKMEALGLLASGLAHDFNNVLTAIAGRSEMLLARTAQDDPRREGLQQIRDIGRRAAGLIRQLLAFSRRSIAEPTIVNLNDVVRENVTMLQGLIGESVQLSTVLDPSLKCSRLDPAQMGQVIVNLAMNARDAMPTGGRLTIVTRNADVKVSTHRGRKPGSYALLGVIDTGVGIPPDVQARIFEPFFTTKEPGKGSGLGLAAVHRIVEESSGFIEVTSEPGRGSSFLIYVPAVRQPPAQAAPTVDYALAHGTETILLVEDDAVVRAVISDFLRELGYRVLAASRADHAFVIAAQHEGPVDLVLTDVGIPGMAATEFVKALRQARPSIRVLFVSGHGAEYLAQHGIRPDQMHFLQKPFAMDVLSTRVREILDE